MHKRWNVHEQVINGDAWLCYHEKMNCLISWRGILSVGLKCLVSWWCTERLVCLAPGVEFRPEEAGNSVSLDLITTLSINLSFPSKLSSILVYSNYSDVVSKGNFFQKSFLPCFQVFFSLSLCLSKFLELCGMAAHTLQSKIGKGRDKQGMVNEPIRSLACPNDPIIN